MIYRASDCGVYDSNEPALVLWFEAANDTDAHSRAEQILSLLWAVPKTDICLNGMPSSELSLERESIERDGNNAGDRRWLQSGSHGEYPTYYEPALTVVFLSAAARKRFDRALAAAVDHARQVIASMQANPPDKYADSFAFTIESMQRFVDRNAAAGGGHA